MIGWARIGRTRAGGVARRGTPLRCGALLLLGAGLLFAGACTSQQERSLSALHFFERGNAAYKAEDYARAIEHFQTAAKLDDLSPDIQYNLGLSYYRVGDWQDAAAHFERAVALDPDFAEAHLNLALSYDKLYNATAAHLHYNLYRSLSTAGTFSSATPGGTAAAGAAGTAGAPPPTALGGPGSGGVPTVPRSTAHADVSSFQAVPRMTANDLAAAVRAAKSGAPGAAGPAGAQGLQAAPQRAAALPGLSAQHRPDGSPQPQQPPNPYEGNAKWWTQDAPSQSR